MLGFSILVRNEANQARGFLVKVLCSVNSCFTSPFKNKSCWFLQEISRLLSSGFHCHNAFWRSSKGFHWSQQQEVPWQAAQSWSTSLVCKGFDVIFFPSCQLNCLVLKSWHAMGKVFWFSIAFSFWGPPHLTPAPITSIVILILPTGTSLVACWLSARLWEMEAAILGEAWVVCPWALPLLTGLLFTHLFSWGHSAWHRFLCVKWAQSETNLTSRWLSSLAGDWRVMSEWGVCWMETSSCSAAVLPPGLSSATCRKKVQGRVTPGTNPKPFTLQSR